MPLTRSFTCFLKKGAMLVNRTAHFIKQSLSASLLLRALMRLFPSLCNSLFRVSSSFTILCVRRHENAAFAGNQMLYNRGTTRCASSSASASWALRVNKNFLIRYSNTNLTPTNHSHAKPLSIPILANYFL